MSGDHAGAQRLANFSRQGVFPAWACHTSLVSLDAREAGATGNTLLLSRSRRAFPLF